MQKLKQAVPRAWQLFSEQSRWKHNFFPISNLLPSLSIPIPINTKFSLLFTQVLKLNVKTCFSQRQLFTIIQFPPLSTLPTTYNFVQYLHGTYLPYPWTIPLAGSRHKPMDCSHFPGKYFRKKLSLMVLRKVILYGQLNKISSGLHSSFLVLQELSKLIKMVQIPKQNDVFNIISINQPACGITPILETHLHLLPVHEIVT